MKDLIGQIFIIACFCAFLLLSYWVISRYKDKRRFDNFMKFSELLEEILQWEIDNGQSKDLSDWAIIEYTEKRASIDHIRDEFLEQTKEGTK